MARGGQEQGAGETWNCKGGKIMVEDSALDTTGRHVTPVGMRDWQQQGKEGNQQSLSESS